MKPIRLTQFFRWFFAVLTVATILGGIAACVGLATYRPTHWELPVTAQVPATNRMTFHETTAGRTVNIDRLQGRVTLSDASGSELLALYKRAAVPLIALYVGFFAMLFDLLRRLFRNVGRGDSFTAGNIRLVQIIGGLLIAMPLVSATADLWLFRTFSDYLLAHADGAVMRMGVQPISNVIFAPDMSGGAGLGWAVFLAGLLVLALAEVFRQGLKLKQDSELTI